MNGELLLKAYCIAVDLQHDLGGHFLFLQDLITSVTNVSRQLYNSPILYQTMQNFSSGEVCLKLDQIMMDTKLTPIISAGNIESVLHEHSAAMGFN